MSGLVLRDLVKTFGNDEVLHGINLEVDDGEFIVLVGPSGCGKSTTLRLIAGLEECTSGEIEIGGRVVNALEPKNRNIAMVFQNYAIYPHMSVRRNIGFGLRSARMPKQEKMSRIEEVAAILEMTEYLGRKPSQLSGGQRQRVAIGRAMVRDPSVFLFDEPLSNLDAQLRTQMRLEIKKLHQSVGRTIIFVTHDQIEAMTLADRIVIMKDGRIQQIGTPTDVYNRPANIFVARFIGAPSMNLVPGRIEKGEVRIAGPGEGMPVTGIRVTEALPDGQVEIGIRPDDLYPSADNALLAGKVVVLEPLGPETLIYVETPVGEVIAKTPAQSAPRVGDDVELGVDHRQVHIFECGSGKAIPTGP